MSAIVHVGNVLDILPTLEAGSVNCVVTSPPYFGLRDYGVDGQLGLEPTPELYVANMVAVFREVRRVLRSDGTLWLNLGDSYNSSPSNQNGCASGSLHGGRVDAWSSIGRQVRDVPGLKPKDLCMIPARVALALQQDGWYLRSDIIWSKPNPMPESVTDRPTKAHEYVFLLTKSARYWYDAEAIRHEPSNSSAAAWYRSHRLESNRQKELGAVSVGGSNDGLDEWLGENGRNRRTVWTIATQPYPEAHFATYPEKLVEPCVLAGCPAQVCGECGAPWAHVVDVDSHPNYTADGQKHDGTYYRPNPGGGVSNDSRTKTDRGWQPTCTHDAATIPGTVLDPFTGSGTTGAVACRLGRNFVGIELSPEYVEMANRRIAPHRDQMQMAVV